jgi:acyl-CoA thioesterase I
MALLAIAPAGANASAGNACPATPVRAALSLPHLRTALAEGQQGVIVALGSSSTAGVRASSPGRSYPARLQALLSDALPDRHIAVINRGISGQDARREVARLGSDAIAVRPQLVIWQVGANAALRNADPVAFHTLVREGIRRLQAADIDVVLMDNQRSPRLLATPDDQSINRELAALASETGVSLFSRDRLMTAWQRDGMSLAGFIARDALHQNDRGYACVARALAEAIVVAVAPSRVTAAR